MGRSVASIVASAGLICIALAGCGPASSPGASTGASATGSPTASVSSSTANATTATGTPSAGGPSASPTPTGPWKNYTTSDGKLTFEVPTSWRIQDPAGATPPGGGVFLQVFNEFGKLMGTLRTNVAPGAECTQKNFYSVILSEPVPALAQQGSVPRFVFEGRANPRATDPAKGNILAYGITSAREPTGQTACPINHVFTWPPSGASFGGTYDPFDTTPGNPMHADTPEIYAQTPEFIKIKKMITSLRPAGQAAPGYAGGFVCSCG